jgi:hypothetical protein
MPHPRPTILTACLFAACSAETPSLTVVASPELEPAATEMVRFLDYPIRLVIAADPAAALPPGSRALAVTTDLDDSGDAYRIEAAGDGYVIRGASLIGAQHGLFRALEGLGFGFFHPFRTHVPEVAGERLADSLVGNTVRPEVGRRGLHLHTLHPIEGYFAVWEPGESNLESARRIINWGIATGANYFQWTALDDVLDPAAGDPWRQHTAAILETIHARGAGAGVGVQLFGASNLQQAYDLIDDPEADPRAQIEARYPPILGELAWDHLSLSFGEFLGEDPDRFIANTNLAYQVLDEMAPGASMSATIHVGADQRVEYQGEDMIYYFLAQFADPAIIPWVHTVMYYNLFEDAGGAYHHDEFDEHRAFLLEKIAAGEPVGYHPETAYWVAFDNSVPIYAPLYLRSRWLDLARIAEAGPLPEHIVFSTGWEWGYWQNDAIAFRQSVSRSPSWERAIEELFAPLGDEGQELAAAAVAVAELEHRHLLEGRLAAYVAGRDAFIDFGDAGGIIAAPDRPSFGEISALEAADRDAFAADVVARLEELAAGLDDIAAGLDGGGSPWRREMDDGLEATAARAHFIAAAYRAALAAAGGGDPEPAITAMEEALDRGAAAVQRRHGQLHHPEADLLVQRGGNATLYQFGYLRQADELCYWERERAQVLNLTREAGLPVPACTQ